MCKRRELGILSFIALFHFLVGILDFGFVYEAFLDLLCYMMFSRWIEGRWFVLLTFATICPIGQICGTHGETLLLRLVGSILHLRIILIVFTFPF